MNVWYPMVADRDYEAVMVAWITQLVNSPVSFPRMSYNPRDFVPAVLPYLDAHVLRPNGLRLTTDGAGAWLGIQPGGRYPEYALVSGQPASNVLELARQSHDVVTWHGGDAFVAGAVLKPWRLFTEVPALYHSRQADLRQAKIIVACQNQGIL